MKLEMRQYVGLGLLAVTIILLAHHYAKHGYLLDDNDIMSHEFVAGLAGALGVGILL